MNPRRFATMTDKTGAAAGVPPQLPRTAVQASEDLSLLARGQPWTDNQASGSRGSLRVRRGRDIAPRCPRPYRGRNEALVACVSVTTLRRCYVARTAQRASPYQNFLVAQGEGGIPAKVTAWVYDWLARRLNAPGELVFRRRGA